MFWSDFVMLAFVVAHKVCDGIVFIVAHQFFDGLVFLYVLVMLLFVVAPKL